MCVYPYTTYIRTSTWYITLHTTEQETQNLCN